MHDDDYFTDPIIQKHLAKFQRELINIEGEIMSGIRRARRMNSCSRRRFRRASTYETRILLPKQFLQKGGTLMLYHADFHIEYPGSMSQKDFFSIWAREAEAALGAKKVGVVLAGDVHSAAPL